LLLFRRGRVFVEAGLGEHEVRRHRSLARELGVSATAVSLALQNSHRISRELRATVQRAAEASGHVPNARLAALMSEVLRGSMPTYRGTIGGNIVNASPAADSPPALLAYDAELEL
jgi:xanthine dehydrogenase iron-sulfur cluster and FAD-binding subunit A